MCGIAGIVAPQAERYREALRRMTDSLAHRGPDGEGSYFFGNCALGHRRLSIVDLETGRQPMLSPVSAASITFNGEIYGYLDIRKELSDYPFHTASDTEVILALYDRFGANFPERLPGMFAVAIWDDARQELFCARDRFGEKPFYYAIGNGGEFIFASEIKAILATGLVTPVLSMEAVGHYLQRLYVPPDRTIYQNVHTLPPGHALTFKNGRLDVRRYWNFPTVAERTSLGDAADRLEELLQQAVGRQMIADVEVGAFLSGGLDSSTIVAVASAMKPDIRTLAFGFEKGANELPYAREVAQLYGTRHFELEDRHCPLDELLATMQKVYDEPFADSSNIPTYLISQQARKHVKVVLTGDGGDELFGGYDTWYQPLYWMSKIREKRTPLHFLARILLEASARAHIRVPKSWDYYRHGYDAAARYSTPLEAHLARGKFFSDEELLELGVPVPATNPPEQGKGGLDDVMRRDAADYMPGDILVKTDRASMAHGLELRAPFLDLDLATFLLAVPWNLKLNGTTDKILLRRAYADKWPQSVRIRGKQGFGAPVAEWLQRPEVRRLKEEYLGDGRKKIFGILPPESIARHVNADSHRTWILLVLSLWMENHDFGC